MSTENLFKYNFSSGDHRANVLAKHLFVKTESRLGNREAPVDDFVRVLFDASGFSDEDLISVPV